MKKILTLIVLVTFNITLLSGVELKFNYSDSYRIESTVYQNVLFNMKIELSSVILNKYSVNLIDSDSSGAKLDVRHQVLQDSKGVNQGYYKTSSYEKSTIFQDVFGNITNLEGKSFPAVQSIPTFPDRDLNVGDSWTTVATEYFDLKNGFNIDEVIKTTYRVFYHFESLENIDGVTVAKISINYNIYEKLSPKVTWGDFFPVKISGGSKEVLYWDIENGRPFRVEDNFFIDFFTSTGDKYTFKGTTESLSWPKNDLRNESYKNLITELNDIPQTKVEEDDESLKITFNSLLFDAESWTLKSTVKSYLDKIGLVLKESGDINIKITGHTALFGENNPDYLSMLSTNRAGSVASYLIDNGYLDIEDIEVIGMGGDNPVDTNDTPEGRSNNRRVEIDILKN